jgi:ribonuclease P protein component
MAESALAVRLDFAMSKKAEEVPSTSRLLRHADFERVYKEGRRHFSASMTVFYWRREEDVKTQTKASAPHGLRVGFTVSRALGGAVQRNRMKRRLREAVRLSNHVAGVAADVVINPKKAILRADFAGVLNEVNRAFAVIEQKLSQSPMGKWATDSGTNKIAGDRKPETES